MAGYEGYAALGELLGGGAQPDGTAYAQAKRVGYQANEAGFSADKAFEEARIARMMANARESLPAALTTANYAPELVPLLGAVVQASQTPDLRRLGNFQMPNAGADLALAREALADKDLGGYNERLASALGEAIEPYSAVAGGKAVMRADTGEIAMTDLGEASMAAEQALAGQRQAAADRARRDPAPKPAPKDAPAGARRAKDGKLYLPDPNRPGKYLLVEE